MFIDSRAGIAAWVDAGNSVKKNNTYSWEFVDNNEDLITNTLIV